MAELTAPTQSPDDRTRAILTRLLGDNRDASRLSDKIVGLLDWTPLGIPQASYSAGQLVGQGAKQVPDAPATGGAKMLAGLLLGAAGVAPGLRGAGRDAEKELAQGIIAYHGSPHKFDAFDASKIGTGEGAQAYGHGLYFAQNEGVARSYRDALAGVNKNPMHDPSNEIGQLAIKYFGSETVPTPSGIMYPNPKVFAEAVAQGRIKPSDVPADLYGAAIKYANPGHMYQVRINASPGQFLDWDKALNVQAPAIKNALFDKHGVVPEFRKNEYIDDYLMPHVNDDYENLKGSEFHTVLQRLAEQDMLPANGIGVDKFLSEGHHKGAVGAFLGNENIAGIKYLDQGSRNVGDGTSNYVVFNPKIVDILKRYGLPLGAFGLGAGAVAGTSTQAQAATAQ